MIRRLAVVLTGLLAAGVLATGAATAAPLDEPQATAAGTAAVAPADGAQDAATKTAVEKSAEDAKDLTPKQKAGLHLVGEVLGALLGLQTTNSAGR